jgi:ABC-type phosphate transport system substrate-binding protein
LWNYEAVGSSGGRTAFLNNDISALKHGRAGAYGTIVGDQVDIGVSDEALTASELTNPATGSYASSPVDGPLIQIPAIGTGIAIPYNTPKPSHIYHLTLTDAQLCGVLSGKITDWHSLVAGIPAGNEIEVVYRSESSDTTFLLTQHLNAVCTASNSSFPILPVPVTRYFYSAKAGDNPVFLSPPPANFIGKSGSSNVAEYLIATVGTIGYLTPDYTNVPQESDNRTSLPAARLLNANDNIAYGPNIENIASGLNDGGRAAPTTPP